MLEFLKNHTNLGISALRRAAKCSAIGVDMADDAVKIAQLMADEKTIKLVAGGSKNRPMSIEPSSADWQRWAIQALGELTTKVQFRSREIIAAMPAREVFIEHAKMPKVKDEPGKVKRPSWAPERKLEDAIFAKVKQKLPFGPHDAVIRYIPTEEDNVLVMAVEREIVDRHLAIYENTDLQVKSIAIWPTALVTTYTGFFGRRKSDIAAVVMLIDIDGDSTNVVICRHKNLLFARSIPIGVKQLSKAVEPDRSYVHVRNEEMVTRLVLELTACKRQFYSIYGNAQIERLIFLSGRFVDRVIYETIAKQLEMPAQMGNCLAAVEIDDPCSVGIDRRECKLNWSTAFGLSLS
ncbi:MAG: pilus assembly protein PilM [Planctomycetota bacterium]|nr:MAG: pilus assembly protein PilM [Planctomycetota bacterium]